MDSPFKFLKEETKKKALCYRMNDQKNLQTFQVEKVTMSCMSILLEVG